MSPEVATSMIVSTEPPVFPWPAQERHDLQGHILKAAEAVPSSENIFVHSACAGAMGDGQNFLYCRRSTQFSFFSPKPSRKGSAIRRASCGTNSPAQTELIPAENRYFRRHIEPRPYHAEPYGFGSSDTIRITRY